jgi:hypothetical protein
LPVRIRGRGPRVVVGVVGSNLLNGGIRNHVSSTKDEVLMPGRSLRFFHRQILAGC